MSFIPIVDNACGQVSWGVRPLLPVVAALACLGFVGGFFIAGAAEDRVVAGVGAVATAGAAVGLLMMRRRLTAGPDGFVVRGPGGTRSHPWTEVTRISAPTRRRRGLASTSVEIDLDDDGLIVLGPTELGVDPAEVAAELRRLWRPGTVQPESQVWK